MTLARWSLHLSDIVKCLLTHADDETSCVPFMGERVKKKYPFALAFRVLGDASVGLRLREKDVVMRTQCWVSCLAVFVFCSAPGLTFGQSKVGEKTPETDTDPETPDTPNDPSGRNELGGVGPVLPYGNDAFPSGGTFASASSTTSGSSAAKSYSGNKLPAQLLRPRRKFSSTTPSAGVIYFADGTPVSSKPRSIRPRRVTIARTR